MFWIRLSNTACESSPFMGFGALQCLGCFSAATLHRIYAVDCLSTRLESLFPDNATQGKESSNNIYSRHASAAASSPSPLSPALSIILLSSPCVAPKSVIIVAFRTPRRRTQPFQAPSSEL